MAWRFKVTLYVLRSRHSAIGFVWMRIILAYWPRRKHRRYLSGKAEVETVVTLWKFRSMGWNKSFVVGILLHLGKSSGSNAVQEILGTWFEVRCISYFFLEAMKSASTAFSRLLPHMYPLNADSSTCSRKVSILCVFMEVVECCFHIKGFGLGWLA